MTVTVTLMSFSKQLMDKLQEKFTQKVSTSKGSQSVYLYRDLYCQLCQEELYDTYKYMNFYLTLEG